MLMIKKDIRTYKMDNEYNEYKEYDEQSYEEDREDGDGWEEEGGEYDATSQQIAEFAYRDLERVGAERDVQSDPIALFYIETKRIIREVGVISDEPIILNAIDRLTFIAHKHPLLYVLGYIYLQRYKTPRAIEDHLVRHGTFNMNDVIRYATHWERWLLLKN